MLLNTTNPATESSKVASSNNASSLNGYFCITGLYLQNYNCCFRFFISKPLQVILSYNQRDTIRDVKFWHLFLKSLPSLFIFEEVPSKKRDRIKIKPLFLLTFITRYSNSEVNKSRTLRDMRQFQGLFFMLKRSSLCSFFFNLRDSTFKTW